MGDSVLGVSSAELSGVIERMLTLFKKLMAWLGILVLPEEEEIEPGMYPDNNNDVMDDIIAGA